MMNDTEMVNFFATLWLSNGGDAEGFSWLWSKIQKRIKQIEEQTNKSKEITGD